MKSGLVSRINSFPVMLSDESVREISDLVYFEKNETNEPMKLTLSCSR